MIAKGLVAFAVITLVASVRLTLLLRVRNRRKSALATARLLSEQPGKTEPGGQVRAAAVLLGIDDVVTGRLGCLVHALFPHSAQTVSKANLDHQMRFLEYGLAELERAAAALQAAGICLALLAGQRRAADLAAVLMRLADVPDEVVRAAAEVGACLHDPVGHGGVEPLIGVLMRYRAEGSLHAVPGPEDLARAIGIWQTAHPEAAAAVSAGITERIRAAMRSADRHGDDQTALQTAMAELGLDSEWAGLAGWPEYARQLSGYDGQILGIARAFAERMVSAQEREGAALDDALGWPVLPSQDRADELGRLMNEFRTDTARYAGQVHAALAAATELAVRGGAPEIDVSAAMLVMDEVPGFLSRCDEHAANGDFAAALIALTDEPLPVARSWRPSKEYEVSCQMTARRLCELTDLHHQEVAQWVSEASGQLRECIDRISSTASAEIAGWERERDQAWTAVEEAADSVKRNAARVLAAPCTRGDAADPVQAAAAVLCVDDVTAASIGQLVRSAIPLPGQIAGSPAIEDHLSAVDKLFKELDRGAVVLSGLDGLFAPLLAANGPAADTGLAQAMAQLAPVPAELSRALGDVLTFLQHPTRGLTDGEMVKEFIHQASHDLLPHFANLTTNDGFVTAVASAVAIPEGVIDNVLADLLFSPDPDAGLVLKDFAKSASKAYLHVASQTHLVMDSHQQVDAAADHIGHAAKAVAPDLIHGVLGHVPFVTLALSATKEIRLYHDHMTTLEKSMKNIAIDTASVAAAITGAELLGHVILGAHTLFLSVPLTIAARKAAKEIKRRPLNQAKAEYERLETTYTGKALEMACGLSAVTHTVMEQERTDYLSRVGWPPAVEQASAPDLAQLISSLRAATAGYANTVRAVIKAEASLPGHALPHGKSAIQSLDRVATALTRCDKQLQSGQYAMALITMTETPLPVPDFWRPSQEYRASCAATATRIGELADRNREEVGRWATGAVPEFRDCSERVGAAISAKAKATKEDCDNARSILDAAAEVVEREVAALGLKICHELPK